MEEKIKYELIDRIQNLRVDEEDDYEDEEEEEPSDRRTGLVYDDEMATYYCMWDLDYPECPERFTESVERCKEYKLVERCQHIQSRPATEEEILLIHSKDYFEEVKKTENILDIDVLEKLSSKYDSIYFHEKSFKIALLAAGSCIDLVSSVLNGEVQNGMAIVRPPGHHAMKNEACGYCYFNNVAIAAKHALVNHGIQRILIVDWDIHHGQGIQYSFYDDPRVLYFSIHRYEHGSFWPELRESDYDYIGDGEGKGFNINIPLNKTGMNDGDYWSIFTNVLLPVAYEYAPELVIISSGFDAAIGCPEGEMKVTPQAYANFLNSLMGLAAGRVCVVLEGGYCISSLAESVAMCLRTLLGDPCPVIETQEPSESIVESVLNVISVHRPYWKNLCLQGSFQDDSGDKQVVKASQRHIPLIKYCGTLSSCKPDSYPTRCCYPQPNLEVIAKYEKQMQLFKENLSLSRLSNRTYLSFDQRMTLHRNYVERGHPEKPARISRAYDKLVENGLLKRCYACSGKFASEEEVALIHSREYIAKMKKTEKMKLKELLSMEEEFRSVYICKSTFQAALLAVGSVLNVVHSVVCGESKNGIAIVRPPGHHAEIEEACGFCIFNSVAIAAKCAMTKYDIKRVLIVDWDIHHGNGIQHAFYDDPRVLYVSIHRHDHGLFFPCLSEANYDAVGNEEGTGFNINIPWNKGGKGDGDYLSVFFHILLPVAYQFNPELVLVSAGFDAAKGDPLGCCKVTPECYGHMTKLLSGLAHGKTILVLEGGYNLTSVSDSVLQCTSSLLGDPCPFLPMGLKPSACALSTIRNVIKTHEKYWTCLKFNANLPACTQADLQNSSLTVGSSLESLSSAGTERSSSLSFSDKTEGNEKVNESLDGACGGGDMPDSFLPPSCYCVVPLEWCPHLELIQPLPNDGLNPFEACQICGDYSENWVCLCCYEVYCGRYINGHMLHHGSKAGHPLTLGYADLSVWCYNCESYIHCEVLQPMKQEAHFRKFGCGYHV